MDRQDEHAMNSIVLALYAIKDGKPNDRSDKAHHYEVAEEEVEKLLAYFREYIYPGYKDSCNDTH